VLSQIYQVNLRFRIVVSVHLKSRLPSTTAGTFENTYVSSTVSQFQSLVWALNSSMILFQYNDMLSHKKVYQYTNTVFEELCCKHFVQHSDSSILWAEKVRYECATHYTSCVKT